MRHLHRLSDHWGRVQCVVLSGGRLCLSVSYLEVHAVPEVPDSRPLDSPSPPSLRSDLDTHNVQRDPHSGETPTFDILGVNTAPQGLISQYYWPTQQWKVTKYIHSTTQLQFWCTQRIYILCHFLLLLHISGHYCTSSVYVDDRSNIMWW